MWNELWSTMPSRPLLFFLLLRFAAPCEEAFVFNGFRGARNYLSLDGAAEITPGGLARLTNSTAPSDRGRLFFSRPIQFRRNGTGGAVCSFSTAFVFAVRPLYPGLSGHGVAFVVSAYERLHGETGSQYMGLFNTSNIGKPSNHLFAVELDTVQNPEFRDPDDNHVGIDVNSMVSRESHRAGYFADSGSGGGGGGGGGFVNLSLAGGDPIQIWVEYDGETMRLDVTASPVGVSKPRRPLLSAAVDLAGVVLDRMHVGFSSTSGTFRSSHYLLGWSFKMNGTAEALDLSSLPPLPPPRPEGTGQGRRHVLVMRLLPWVAAAAALLLVGGGIFVLARRRIKYAELLEDWEQEYKQHRFSYKELFDATHGFDDGELLGEGGFGRVYKGVLPNSGVDVAIKRISHGSSQGMKEFVAEIVSIGRLRHRNLVELLGYCRRRGELLLVYSLMPGGSLDKRLFNDPCSTLDWKQRLGIIRGVASGLLYLHEGWEKVVIHRDVKASNILLDGELNGRLGDFGLARMYDHGCDPQRTHVVGTVGYLAPEMIRTRRATKSTDVFSFGVFLLEVTGGRRPVDTKAPEEELVLADWVLRCWRNGRILDAVDPRLSEFVESEAERVLKLGLLCCDPVPAARLCMRQVVLLLEGGAALPEFALSRLSSARVLTLIENEALDAGGMSHFPVTASFLYDGR